MQAINLFVRLEVDLARTAERRLDRLGAHENRTKQAGMHAHVWSGTHARTHAYTHTHTHTCTHTHTHTHARTRTEHGKRDRQSIRVSAPRYDCFISAKSPDSPCTVNHASNDPQSRMRKVVLLAIHKKGFVLAKVSRPMKYKNPLAEYREVLQNENVYELSLYVTK